MESILYTCYNPRICWFLARASSILWVIAEASTEAAQLADCSGRLWTGIQVSKTRMTPLERFSLIFPSPGVEVGHRSLMCDVQTTTIRYAAQHEVLACRGTIVFMLFGLLSEDS